MSQSLKCSFSHTVDLSQVLFLLGYYYGMKKLIYDSSITKFMGKVYEYYIFLYLCACMLGFRLSSGVFDQNSANVWKYFSKISRFTQTDLPTLTVAWASFANLWNVLSPMLQRAAPSSYFTYFLPCSLVNSTLLRALLLLSSHIYDQTYQQRFS